MDKINNTHVIVHVNELQPYECYSFFIDECNCIDVVKFHHLFHLYAVLAIWGIQLKKFPFNCHAPQIATPF
jgi:hypothetical protein